jgi:hypothetical protein
VSEAAAHALRDHAPELAQSLPTDPAVTARVLSECAESFMNFSVVARRELEQRALLGETPEVLATVPFFDTDISDMAGLLRLGQQIWD